MALLSGMTSGPRSSILHLFGTILYEHVLRLSCLGWHAQNELGECLHLTMVTSCGANLAVSALASLL